MDSWSTHLALARLCYLDGSNTIHWRSFAAASIDSETGPLIVQHIHQEHVNINLYLSRQVEVNIIMLSRHGSNNFTKELKLEADRNHSYPYLLPNVRIFTWNRFMPFLLSDGFKFGLIHWKIGVRPSCYHELPRYTATLIMKFHPNLASKIYVTVAPGHGHGTILRKQPCSSILIRRIFEPISNRSSHIDTGNVHHLSSRTFAPVQHVL